MDFNFNFLRCSRCSEYLHVRVFNDISVKTGKILKKQLYELYCPACNKVFNSNSNQCQKKIIKLKK